MPSTRYNLRSRPTPATPALAPAALVPAPNAATLPTPSRQSKYQLRSTRSNAPLVALQDPPRIRRPRRGPELNRGGFPIAGGLRVPKKTSSARQLEARQTNGKRKRAVDEDEDVAPASVPVKRQKQQPAAIPRPALQAVTPTAPVARNTQKPARRRVVDRNPQDGAVHSVQRPVGGPKAQDVTARSAQRVIGGTRPADQLEKGSPLSLSAIVELSENYSDDQQIALVLQARLHQDEAVGQAEQAHEEQRSTPVPRLSVIKDGSQAPLKHSLAPIAVASDLPIGPLTAPASESPAPRVIGISPRKTRMTNASSAMKRAKRQMQNSLVDPDYDSDGDSVMSDE